MKLTSKYPRKTVPWFLCYQNSGLGIKADESGNNVLLLVFLDLSAIFDTIKYGILLDHLRRSEIEGMIYSGSIPS